MFLRDQNFKLHFEYVRDLGLNTIRLEGKIESEYFN